MSADTTIDLAAHNAAAKLKTEALKKLNLARACLDDARQTMADLEGIGYCQKYEKAGEIHTQMVALTTSFARLAPPTGVFTC
jgi:hypothetical protein